MSKILAIGDIHCPVEHPGYMSFCQDLYEKYGCDKTVLIGDVVDWHAISFHTRHPDAPGPKDEYNLSKAKIAEWYKAFPVADVCIGNHDERVIRVAEEAGIPSMFLRHYAEVWATPNWTWSTEFMHDNVYYFHGTGCGGMHPAFNAMKKMLMSVVMGHIHSAAGVKWAANPERRIFGLDLGCGIDDKAYAFAYGKHQKTRSVLGAGVILDGVPHHEIMPIGPGEKYHRSRFEKKDEVIHGKRLGKTARQILADVLEERETAERDRLAGIDRRRAKHGLPKRQGAGGGEAEQAVPNRDEKDKGRRRSSSSPQPKRR